MLVARGDRASFARGDGEAGREKWLPHRPETRFGLGSMGRMFTAVAVAQPAEQGKLSRDDPLGKYLSLGWLSAADRKAIALRPPLSHAAGTGDNLADPRFTGARGKCRRVDDYKPLFADAKVTFLPGTRYQYGNSGTILLGAVIEKVGGGPCEDTVRSVIWGPPARRRPNAPTSRTATLESRWGTAETARGDQLV